MSKFIIENPFKFESTTLAIDLFSLDLLPRTEDPAPRAWPGSAPAGAGPRFYCAVGSKTPPRPGRVGDDGLGDGAALQ